MKITRITYSRLYSLPDYENERYEYTVELAEDDRTEEVIAFIKEAIENDRNALSDKPEPKQPDPYALYNSANVYMRSFDSPLEWLETYDQGLSKAGDVRLFISNNIRELVRLHGEAKHNKTLFAMADNMMTRTRQLAGEV